MKALKATINEAIESLALRLMKQKSAYEVQTIPSYYFCQVVYETVRPGRKWLMRVFFGRDLNTFIKVFKSLNHCYCSYF